MTNEQIPGAQLIEDAPGAFAYVTDAERFKFTQPSPSSPSLSSDDASSLASSDSDSFISTPPDAVPVFSLNSSSSLHSLRSLYKSSRHAPTVAPHRAPTPNSSLSRFLALNPSVASSAHAAKPLRAHGWLAVAASSQGARSLYAAPESPSAFDNLRSAVCALMDHADVLRAHNLVLALPRESPDLNCVIHSLMYVGGAVISSSSDFVLVGIDV